LVNNIRSSRSIKPVSGAMNKTAGGPNVNCFSAVEYVEILSHRIRCRAAPYCTASGAKAATHDAVQCRAVPCIRCERILKSDDIAEGGMLPSTVQYLSITARIDTLSALALSSIDCFSTIDLSLFWSSSSSSSSSSSIDRRRRQ